MNLVHNDHNLEKKQELGSKSYYLEISFPSKLISKKGKHGSFWKVKVKGE
jgi:hypothetical protein